jgi:hypothetical protein
VGLFQYLHSSPVIFIYYLLIVTIQPVNKTTLKTSQHETKA